MIKKLIKKLFYYLVYKEYIKENKGNLLCHNSKLFQAIWIYKKESIKKDAELFLKMNPEINELAWVGPDAILFYMKESVTYMRYTRIQFLHWMVYNKLKNINEEITISKR